MKRFLCAVVSSVLCMTFLACTMFALAGCGAQETNNDDASLNEYNIGDQLDVYPNCKFNYQVNDDCVVVVNSIKVTLAQKNVIEANETVLEPYYPYVFHVYANGYTDKKFAGKTIYLLVIVEEMYKQFFYYEATIENDGSIIWEYDQQTWTSATKVFFHSITFNV